VHSAGADTAASTPRLFVLERGVDRPLDLALAPGRHELRDLGVVVDFDGERVRASSLGFGPSAFALPGTRALRVGAPTALQPGDTLSWAGRSWLLFTHPLPGAGRAPPRGLCKNAHGTGHPLDAVLLVVAGGERGNFFRVRSEPLQWAPNAFVRGQLDGDGALRVEVRYKGRADADGGDGYTPVADDAVLSAAAAGADDGADLAITGAFAVVLVRAPQP
jgi:hypothetical protein